MSMYHRKAYLHIVALNAIRPARGIGPSSGFPMTGLSRRDRPKQARGACGPPCKPVYVLKSVIKDAAFLANSGDAEKFVPYFVP